MFFSFLRPLKQKIHDMKTISRLCQGAEKHANINGEEKPGAEHFMLSALDLPDGTARRVFKRLNIDPNGINQAIKQQHIDALNEIGIDHRSINIDLNTPEVAKSNSKLYDAQPSAQVLMQELHKRNKNRNTPLIGANVLEIIASMENGIAARTLRAMGIDSGTLKKAIESETSK